jgi:cytochrome P450
MSYVISLGLPILGSFILFALYQIYRFVVRPIIQLQYYKKQGLEVNFVPVFGFFKNIFEDLNKHGDILYSWKEKNYQNPKPKAFASNFGDRPHVALKDPELIKQFYILQEKFYIKAPGAVNVAKLILRNGTITAEGNIWKQHRKLSGPAYNYEVLRERIPEIVQIIDESFDKLKKKDLSHVDFMTEIQLILADVCGKIFLGIELSQLEFKGKTVSAFVCELVDRAGAEGLNPFTLLFTTDIVTKKIHPRHKILVTDIEDLRGFLFGAAKAKLGEILAEKQNNPTPNKKPLLLELLYEQHLKQTQEGITAVDIVDEFANFFLGTVDTTSHVINFASYYHLTNPASQKKLMEEVNKFFQDPSKVTLDSLNQMDYMTAVIKETLRLAAPLPILLPRVALQDHKLGDLNIKAGTVINIAAVNNSFDPEYHDEPDKFIPERWLDANSRTRRSISKNAEIYIPFSTGPRTCPGQQQAMNEARIVLALFLKKFDYSLADKNYEMRYGIKFFSEPAEALIYNLKPKTA